MGRVLVAARVDPTGDAFGELRGAQPVRQLRLAKVLDDRVDDLDREGGERGVGGGFLRKIRELRRRLGLAALDEVAIGKVRAAGVRSLKFPACPRVQARGSRPRT